MRGEIAYRKYSVPIIQSHVNGVNHHCELPKLTISEQKDAQRPSVHANMGTLQCPMEMAPADEQHDGVAHNDRHSSEDEHCQTIPSAAIHYAVLR